MLSIIIQYSVISVVMILLLHYLYNFFKDTLTVPKVKDLIHHPGKQYEKIFESIQKNGEGKMKMRIGKKSDSNKEDMKNELKNYLNELNNKNSSEQNDVEPSGVSSSSYTSINALPNYDSF